MLYLTGLIEEMGFPVGAKFAVNCPFDMFADNMRGIMQVLVDMRERPDELMEVIDKMEVISINNAVNTIRATGAQFCFIPLHNGVDEFMSREDYLKFYWKGLKNLMDAIIAEGCIPYVFCEGKYKTRLDIISDVPKGKVIYMFEETDIKLVKETVGQVACICGNLETALLMFGSKAQVGDGVKRMLDVCAPGGGFIMDISIGLEECNMKNLEVFFESAMKYGVY
jgi:uroporphyrinogen-III decarboxylase